MAEYANSQLNLLEAIRGLTLTAERCPKVLGMRVTPVQTWSRGCGGERGLEVYRGAASDNLAPPAAPDAHRQDHLYLPPSPAAGRRRSSTTGSRRSTPGSRSPGGAFDVVSLLGMDQRAAALMRRSAD